jgi:hypothetical protein
VEKSACPDEILQTNPKVLCSLFMSDTVE